MDAPPDIVWSFLRDFFDPMPYKIHIVSCHRVSGDGGVGSIRVCQVREGIAARFSVERCEIMDEENHICSFQVVGGQHRCRNYQSVTSLHERIQGVRRKTLVIESYICDIERGNTATEVEVYCDGFVKELLTRLNEVSSAKYRSEQARASSSH
ncbi:hypothetical protein Mapa_008366 [Marchantia paleacea]|nr:hypothetical protein Mapa_008366 [Marchantia paleacea]